MFEKLVAFSFTSRFVFALVATIVLSTPAVGQVINTSTPFFSGGESYFENHGVNWGFSFPGGRGPGSRVVGLNQFGQLTPNLTFGFGGSNAATPAFGGFNPAAATTFGFQRVGGNGSRFSFGLTLSKGSERQNVTTAPSLTTMNGQGGSLSNGSIRPFVTSVVPVLGHAGNPTVPMTREVTPSPFNGVTKALSSGQLSLGPSPSSEPLDLGPRSYSDPQSTATKAATSVQSIKAERQKRLAAKQRQVDLLLEEAAKLESEQNFSDARIKYREALGATDDDSTKARIKRLIKATRTKG